MPGCGGHHQQIHLLPQRLQLALHAAQRVLHLEGVGGAEARRAADDLAHGWVEGLGLRGEQLAHHAVALGHPGAFIQQRRHCEQRREVQLHHQLAQAAGALDGGGEHRRIADIAEEGRRLRHADARSSRQLRRAGNEVAVRVERVVAFGQRQQQRGIVHRVREQRHAVDAAAGRQHAGGADAPRGGLEADQTVKACRHTPRTRRVGTQRKSHLAARHGHRRAGTGAAADALRIEHAGRPAVG